MGYSISVKIDAVYQSKSFKGFFTLAGEDIGEIKEVAKRLVSEILSFPERKVDKKDLSRIIPSSIEVEKIELGVSKTVGWLDLGYKSDVGRVRELDEDSLVIITTETSYGEEYVLLVLGDGVGGHNKGEVASYLGTTIVAEELTPLMLSIPNNAKIKNSIVYSIKKANDEILNYVMSHPECEGMATTMTVALLRDQNLYVGNVGDSRAYIINQDEIRQVTKDHSLVQELVDAGKITKEEARHHPQKNIVTRVVGYYRDIEVDIFEKKIWKEDVVMLCCDGLSDVLRDDEIKDVIVKNEDRQRACDKLVKITNERGGPDNISVITAHSNKIPSKKEKREEEKGIPVKEPSILIRKKKILVPIACAVILLCFMGFGCMYYGHYYLPMKANEDLIENFYACMNTEDYHELSKFCLNGSNASKAITNFTNCLNDLGNITEIMIEGGVGSFRLNTAPEKYGEGYRIKVTDTVKLFIENVTIFREDCIVEYITKLNNTGHWKIYEITYHNNSGIKGESYFDTKKIINLDIKGVGIKEILRKYYPQETRVKPDLLTPSPTPTLYTPERETHVMHVSEIEMETKPINFTNTMRWGAHPINNK